MKKICLIVLVATLMLSGCVTVQDIASPEDALPPVEYDYIVDPESAYLDTKEMIDDSSPPEAMATIRPEGTLIPVSVDPNLLAALREQLGIPDGPIYIEDLQALSDLFAVDYDIYDANGLQFCIGVTHLTLAWNSISNVSYFGALPGGNVLVADPEEDPYSFTVLRLNLTGNNIEDISALSGLTGPDELTLKLGANRISDISPLNGLTNLVALYLKQNRISNISSLAALTNLSILELWGNDIVDITPLAGLTNLRSLELSYNDIIDPSPLAALTNLRVLNLSNNKITDASSLAVLNETCEILLEGNPLV